ncbi:MAG: hypothetical protein Q8Q54_08100 [Methylococcales bacterium]|nr:hypothetical protein [Methylococcales bacterium]MDP3010902.1 hypothetical protein [Methylococcales bacterium]MDP3838868.1 hypothetical protein [Methylococcales bacterium]
MKKIIYVCIFVFIISGCGSESGVLKDTELKGRTTTNLDYRNEIAFAPNENVPYTGKLEKYYSNGKKQVESNYKDGKLNGLFTSFYENGRKKVEANHKNGMKNGLATLFDENEQKKSEMNYKDDELNGLFTLYENGQKQAESIYKDGKEIKESVYENETQKNANDSMQKIKNRCQTQTGEYGAAMVKACIDQDLEAVKTINIYFNNHGNIVIRCLEQMEKYGYTMVKACIEQDVAAENALRKY